MTAGARLEPPIPQEQNSVIARVSNLSGQRYIPGKKRPGALKTVQPAQTIRYFFIFIFPNCKIPVEDSFDNLIFF